MKEQNKKKKITKMILRNHVKIIINIKPTFAFFYLFIYFIF